MPPRITVPELGIVIPPGEGSTIGFRDAGAGTAPRQRGGGRNARRVTDHRSPFSRSCVRCSFRYTKQLRTIF